MPITREYVKNNPNDLARKDMLDRCMANDEWATKIFKNVAILINSYPGHRAYLKACVDSHSKLGYFIALAYDRGDLPDKEILDKIDLILLPHTQSWGDVNYPYFWQVKWGASVLQQFDYIYVTEGDWIIEKPEGFDKLLSLIGDGDIMTVGPDNDIEISSGAFIVKSKAFLQLVQYMQDHFIPFEKYEQYPHMGGAESRMRAGIKELGLKMVSVSEFPTPDCYYDLKGTWYDLVGLRHIQGEIDYAYKNRLVPPNVSYIDGKYLLSVYNYQLVKAYWDTGDIKILEEWWKK